MCVLVVKSDKDGNPDRSKSRIIVLGNHEDKLWNKSQRYAPVLQYSSLRLLVLKAVGDCRVLQQGNCKNEFCNATLPENERLAVCPPAGDPRYDKDEFWYLKKTLYGLRRSPHHWYNAFTEVLTSMGLKASVHDPCLFNGVVDPQVDPQDPTSVLADVSATLPVGAKQHPVYVGIHVDEFVFYLVDPAEELRFKRELEKRFVVEFMDGVDYFLGTAFTWLRHGDGHVSVHLSQTAFTEFTAHHFGVDE
jgi:hypothetical protein